MAFSFSPAAPYRSSTLSSLASVVSKSGPKTRMIQVHQTLGPGDSSEYLFHQSLECSGSVHQPKGHHPEFIEPSLRNEGSFLPVCGAHLYLPVSASQVEATEKPCAAEGVEAVLNVTERVGVYLRDLIESSVLDTKPRRSILLLHQDGRTAPRTVALLDDPDGQHVFNELPLPLPARRRVASNSLFNRGYNIASGDPVRDGSRSMLFWGDLSRTGSRLTGRLTGTADRTENVLGVASKTFGN